MDGVCWAAEMFCNTRLFFFIVDNVSSVFVKSVFKSSASCPMYWQFLFPLCRQLLHCNAYMTLVELQSSRCFMS